MTSLNWHFLYPLTLCHCCVVSPVNIFVCEPLLSMMNKAGLKPVSKSVEQFLVFFPHVKEFEPNPPGASSFWVWTSVWESLLKAKKFHLYSHFTTWALHDHLLCMMKKGLFTFFKDFWQCKRMPRHSFAGQNTQHVMHLSPMPCVFVWQKD